MFMLFFNENLKFKLLNKTLIPYSELKTDEYCAIFNDKVFQREPNFAESKKFHWAHTQYHAEKTEK